MTYAPCYWDQMQERIMSAPKAHSVDDGHRDDDRYLGLVRQFPLRPLRTKRDYIAATKAMDDLAVRGEEDLNDDELDYLVVLTDLVEAYDSGTIPNQMKVLRSSGSGR